MFELTISESCRLNTGSWLRLAFLIVIWLTTSHCAMKSGRLTIATCQVREGRTVFWELLSNCGSASVVKTCQTNSKKKKIPSHLVEHLCWFLLVFNSSTAHCYWKQNKLTIPFSLTGSDPLCLLKMQHNFKWASALSLVHLGVCTPCLLTWSSVLYSPVESEAHLILGCKILILNEGLFSLQMK